VLRDPASAVARMDYAVFLAQQNRPVDALKQMLACTAAHPQNAEAQYRLGLILTELRQYAPALRAMHKAVKLDPQHTSAAQALRQLKSFVR
jgi:tetratricopeptide (TPR) repeat protein